MQSTVLKYDDENWERKKKNDKKNKRNKKRNKIKNEATTNIIDKNKMQR